MTDKCSAHYVELEAELKAALCDRDNLLAIIHRDGGHHTSAVGARQSVADAHEVWGRVIAERDAFRAECVRLADALHRQALDAAGHHGGDCDCELCVLANERDVLRAENAELRAALAQPPATAEG